MALFERWGATDEEVAMPLPGDELLTRPYLSATRSITVDGSPSVVLAWLTQMGTGRAGWYSYDLIDNFGRRSATEINDAWRVTEVGDVVPAGPASFEVAHLTADSSAGSAREQEPQSVEFVLSLPETRLAGHDIGFTLAYRAVAEGKRSRIISRARANVSGPLDRVINPLLAAGDGVMVRRQLLGLERRCGGGAQPAQPSG